MSFSFLMEYYWFSVSNSSEFGYSFNDIIGAEQIYYRYHANV